MPLKIVFLDDEPNLCELFQEMFESPKVKIRSFSEPAQAMESIKRDPPDLIFIDYRLPRTTGDKLALEIDPAIPKVLVTGELSLQTEYQFTQIVHKPYQIEEIQSIIDSYVVKKSA